MRRGGPLCRSRVLVLAHCWVAFVVFAAAAVLGRLADVGAQPAARAFRQSGELFPLGHRAWRLDGFVLTTFFVMGFGYFVAETALRRAMPACAGPGWPLCWASLGPCLRC